MKVSKERKELHDFLPYLKNLSVLQGPTVNFIDIEQDHNEWDANDKATLTTLR